FRERVLEAERPVVVDFHADWCGPCHQMSPVLEGLAEELGDEVEFVKLDVDGSPDVASAYRVSSIPTIIRFDGGRPTRWSVGVRSAHALSRELRLRPRPRSRSRSEGQGSRGLFRRLRHDAPDG
ncbi:MAG: thioredoxin, partial [Actinomycetota bacterium]|nr:thioredoxin [Actinomycetota bacterium]